MILQQLGFLDDIGQVGTAGQVTGNPRFPQSLQKFDTAGHQMRGCGLAALKHVLQPVVDTLMEQP